MHLVLFNSVIILNEKMFPSSVNNWCLFTPMRKQEFVLLRDWDQANYVS